MAEKQTKVGSGIALDPDVISKLNEMAEAQDRSRSYMANMALRDWLGLPPRTAAYGGKI